MTTLLSFSELEIRRRNRVRNVDLITENEREIKKKKGESIIYLNHRLLCVFLNGHGVNLSHEGSKVNISHLLSAEILYTSLGSQCMCSNGDTKKLSSSEKVNGQ